jgi:integrase
VKHHLPVYLQPIVAFAYIIGWRTPNEILPLEWRQVDMKAGEVRLDPGTTKNDDGSVFRFTSALRRLLDDQQQVAETLKRERGTIALYVFCYTTDQKAGQGFTEGGFNKAWRKARVAAGFPGRIPHDFRRTAVRNLAGRRARASGHAAHRPQDTFRVRTRQHHKQRRPAGRGAAARYLRVCRLIFRLPLDVLRWGVIVVVLYTAVTLIRSALADRAVVRDGEPAAASSA